MFAYDSLFVKLHQYGEATSVSFIRELPLGFGVLLLSQRTQVLACCLCSL